MNLKSFLRFTDNLFQCDNKALTLDWIEFLCDLSESCETDIEDEMHDTACALGYIKQNFSPKILQGVYKKLMLPNELIWAALYLQSGCEESHLKELANNGIFECGWIPNRKDEVGSLKLITINDGKTATHYNAWCEDETYFKLIMQRALEKAKNKNSNIGKELLAYSNAVYRIESMTQERYDVFNKNYEVNTAIGERVTVDSESGTVDYEINPLLLYAGQEIGEGNDSGIMNESKTISLVFSKVKISTHNDSVEFLVGGVPKEYDDLESWSSFEKFMSMINQETEIYVSVESYRYGEGDTSNAFPHEIAYLQECIEDDTSFLSDHTEKIAVSDFTIDWSPDELFSMKME